MENILTGMTDLSILLVTIYKFPEPVNQVQLSKRHCRELAVTWNLPAFVFLFSPNS